MFYIYICIYYSNYTLKKILNFNKYLFDSCKYLLNVNIIYLIQKPYFDLTINFY